MITGERTWMEPALIRGNWREWGEDSCELLAHLLVVCLHSNGPCSPSRRRLCARPRHARTLSANQGIEHAQAADLLRPCIECPYKSLIWGFVAP